MCCGWALPCWLQSHSLLAAEPSPAGCGVVLQVGPGLESALHDSERALEVAKGTKSEMDGVKSAVQKITKKVGMLLQLLVTGRAWHRQSESMRVVAFNR